MVVQWYKSLVKVSMNQTNVLEGSTAVVKDRDKDQGSWIVNSGGIPSKSTSAESASAR